VYYDELSVPGTPNIEFDEIGTQRNTPANGGDCVFRSMSCRPSMADAQNLLR
jgi:hypothetical protein